MRTRIVMFVWVIAGCGDVGPKQSDASVTGAGAICDPTGTFDAPVLLTGFSCSAINVHGRIDLLDLKYG